METVKINMVPKGAVKVAHASQGDAPRVVRFELFDEFLPYTLDGSEDITLTVVRPDTEEIVSTVTNTEEAYIDVSFTSEMTAIRGVANCEIKISKSGADLGSHNFDLNIERDAYGEDITVETASGAIATFITNVIDLLQEVKCEIKATGGNGTPDNPNPIVGYSSANITRCGVNLLGGEHFADLIVAKIPRAVKDTANKTITYEGQFAQNIALFDKFKPNTQYTFFIKRASGYANLKIIYTDGTLDQITTFQQTSANNKSILNLSGEWQSGTSVVSYDECGVFEGVKTVEDFEPYNGNTVTIAFGQTVYGGVLDVTRGKLHGTWGSVDLGSLNYSYESDNKMFYATFNQPRAYANRGYPYLCPFSQYGSDIPWNNTTKEGLWLCPVAVSTTPRIYIRSLAYTDSASFKAAMNGMILAYELATPFDIDLTPVQIEDLLGVNNVWSDTNGETEVKFYVKES